MVKQTIKIFCRVKPTRQRTGIFSIEEDESQTKSTIEFVVPKDLGDGFVNNKKENYKFAFQKVFEQQAKQDDVFDHVAKDVVDNVLSGYNGTIFAYGQTGSGKTFTITGGAEKYADRGIIPRTLSYIYEKYEADQDHIHSTEISYLEIYNENGYDLLDPRHDAAKLEDLPKLSLMEDSDQCIHLKNLSLLPAQNIEAALNLLFMGDTNRMIAETPMNQASTRSHCIFTIHITSREPGSATIRRSKLHLVDLAGSERVTKTQVGGQLLTEVKYINLSLHYLEQVIVALSEKNRQHIPYRNSMMTSVLRDSLGGNCMTTMIATVAIDKKNLDESISTCRFAQRVALIKNEATLNEELDPKLMIVRLKKEIRSLKDDLTLVTGEQRSDELTQEEIDELNQLIECYLKDSDLEATLDVGGDMRKIQYSYSVLKKHALKQGPSTGSTDENPNEDSINSQRSIKPSQDEEGSSLSPMEIKRLKEILQQRDNEINILVNMLKKERKRAMDAESRASSNASSIARSGVNTAPEHARSSGYNSAVYESESEQRTDGKSPISPKSRVKDPQMSAGRQEAFEIFKQNYGNNEIILDQKERLKQRYGEAKVLGMKVNDTRNTMNHLKTDLEQLRKQRAIKSAMDDTQDESFEENEREILIRQQMEEVKIKYKDAFTKLKAMKTEIDHLHHLLDKTRVKMQKDFEVWWDQQSRRPPSAGVRPPSAQRRVPNGFSNSHSNVPLPPSSINPNEAWKTPPESPMRSPKDWEQMRSRHKPPSPLSPRNSLTAIRNTMADNRVRELDRSQNLNRQGGDANVPPLAPNFMSPSSANFRLPNSFPLGAPVSQDSLAQNESRHSAPLTQARHGGNNIQQIQRSFSSGPRSLKPASDQRIPLTGDSTTDANILAFVKARESLMQKNGKFT